MGPKRRRRRSVDKLSIIVFSGEFDKVHYALVMAASAAATGTPVTLFFTMGALRALLAPGAVGAPGWRSMPSGGTESSGGTRDDDFQAKGVGGFEELLSANAEMGVRFMVCAAGLRALGLERGELRSDIAIEEGGMVTFLNDASRHGATVFV